MATSTLVADLQRFIDISEHAQTVYKNIHYPQNNNQFSTAQSQIPTTQTKTVLSFCIHRANVKHRA
jgi:hypothetical protein